MYKVFIAIVLVISVVILWFLHGVMYSPTFVFFSMQGCGHCRDFKPVWENLKNVNIELAGERLSYLELGESWAPYFEVNSFPTLRLYPWGLRGKYVEYSGNRTVNDITQFLHSTQIPIR